MKENRQYKMGRIVCPLKEAKTEMHTSSVMFVAN